MKSNKKELLIYKVLIIVLVIIAFCISGVLIHKWNNDAIYDSENQKIANDFTNAVENPENGEKISLTYNGYNVIGLIEIPAINLKYPILDKTTKETMATSISRFSGGDINGYGNVSLAGHNNYSGTMFGKNKNLKQGDKIYLTDLTKNKIEYKINSIFTTDPNDISILETTDKTKREVTLITCKNGRSNRLIIKADEV